MMADIAEIMIKSALYVKILRSDQSMVTFLDFTYVSSKYNFKMYSYYLLMLSISIKQKNINSWEEELNT